MFCDFNRRLSTFYTTFRNFALAARSYSVSEKLKYLESLDKGRL